jgi:hypothetical protein
MTEHTLRTTFEANAEDINKLINEEIRRLMSLGYSRAAICERSFDIEDEVKARFARAEPMAHLDLVR